MELFTEFRKYGFIYELRLSVALDISYSLLSTAELRGEITKQPNTYACRMFWIPSSYEC